MSKIIFVCRRNSCRSQMAEGWATYLGAGQIIAHSAGLEAATVHPQAIAVMAEVGIDLTSHISNALSDFTATDYDAVISMCGCGVSLPEPWLTRPRFEDWHIEDPDGRSPAKFREVRDLIKTRIDDLLQRLTAAENRLT